MCDLGPLLRRDGLIWANPVPLLLLLLCLPSLSTSLDGGIDLWTTLGPRGEEMFIVNALGGSVVFASIACRHEGCYGAEIRLATEPGDVVWATTLSAVYRGPDEGKSWEKSPEGFPLSGLRVVDSDATAGCTYAGAWYDGVFTLMPLPLAFLPEDLPCPLPSSCRRLALG